MKDQAFYLTVVAMSAMLDIYAAAFWMLGFVAASVVLAVPALFVTWPACKAAKRWAESVAASLTK